MRTIVKMFAYTLSLAVLTGVLYVGDRIARLFGQTSVTGSGASTLSDGLFGILVARADAPVAGPSGSGPYQEGGDGCPNPDGTDDGPCWSGETRAST